MNNLRDEMGLKIDEFLQFLTPKKEHKNHKHMQKRDSIFVERKFTK